ncbi:hypothetical protein QTH90_27680 [Variovorax sp. J2P1-59]|uniref:hypothetical protein n=1 Tax=Variovorax flavidus TaxID=3053501 RepID=UPI002577B009|nr:hypothetical protein [Variovorax sp. J2P1-59]MDM0078220.1 hypothetical protein [Variovorax sp. J2P1-59]
MQVIYYSHSYRPADEDVNEFFQELMVDEQLMPSLDPPSARLNSAKPERHLRSTDAMVAVVTWRDPAPSQYIQWEIGLGLRARKPQLVFVEDVLPDDLVPAGVLQRRFSRRRLLREARDHRHGIRLLKSYVGDEPPPTYQPARTRRTCVIVGATQLDQESRGALLKLLEERRYSPLLLPRGRHLPDDLITEQTVQCAAVCIAVVEGLTPAEYYLLGVARSALTPCILLTRNPTHPYHPIVPREYQPRYVPAEGAADLVQTITTELDVFEEDYLELTEEKQIKRYKGFQEALLRSQRDRYSEEARRQVFNFMGKTEFDMSKDKIQLSNIVGPVNIKSRLDNVVQTVKQAPGWSADRQQELERLITDLESGLQAVAKQRPDDAERVTKTAELVVSEATKTKPDRSFLSISVEGLKQAAQAVADIAPPVLATAGKIAAFVAALA